MVSKQRYHEIQGGPPPLDESWWEAILSDDEYEAGPACQSYASHEKTGSAYQKPSRQAPEPEPIDWERTIELYEQDCPVELEVHGFNRGGLLVKGDRLQGFVPISHLIDMPEMKDDPEPWLATYVGKRLLLKVIECEQERGRIVFSERAALAMSGSRNMLLSQLKPGDRVHGTVTNITDFGVFVDLGGVEGLIHVSELSWGRVRHPADVVQLGEYLEVFVINVDRDRNRVALSLKRLYPNPWETAEERYFPGQIIEAVITSIVPFGAFARLEEGLDGLIHITEICPDAPPKNLGDILHEGQRVRVRVLHVDGSRQRLGLSMRLFSEEK
ncbi:MAG: S1 RNA-binding domain-containing protein [Chloroflexi bacterium]|jgi:small subunit ribosomal protein S1|nr:S1 RNA-binding domain-containing protein [Chloroflexota bacterium]